MVLTTRDTKIINFVADNGGATIEQIQKKFFPSYNVAAKRLSKLQKNKLIKCKIHPVLNKKVYYTVKLPSVHRLVLTSLSLQINYKYFQREYKIAKKVVDGIFITNSDKIIIVEVDIFNRTTDDKLKAISKALQGTHKPYIILVVSKAERRGAREWEKSAKIKRIGIDEVNTYKIY